jgi:ribokinase
MRPDVVVVGQLARDLVVVVDRVPGPGESGTARERREMLGGKGANQAVALAQAERDGIDTSAVVRRPGARTGLVVDVVDSSGKWRYLEDLPPSVQLDKTDVPAAADVVRTDAREASLLAGTAIGGPGDARRAAAEILRRGPALVALAVGDEGNYFAWPEGDVLVPLTPPGSRTRPARATRSPPR